MRTTPTGAITVLPNRQRNSFEPQEQQDLSNSIQAVGLLHPIVLREEQGALFLVAGERRLRSVIDLHELGLPFYCDGTLVLEGHVPYILLGDLGPLEREEAEWEENNRRVDLTWQETARAAAKLEQLRNAQAREKGEDLPTLEALTRELYPNAETVRGTTSTAVRQRLIVAKHLQDPEVASQKSIDDAFKLLKKRDDAERHRTLSAEVGLTYSTDLHTIHKGEAKVVLGSIPSSGFNGIITDPPYGIGADEFGDSGEVKGVATGGHQYDDSPENLCSIISWFPQESYRVTNQNAFLYVFCAFNWFNVWSEALAKAGWRVFSTPLIWHKPHGARAPWYDSGPQRKYELILYAIKGEQKVNVVLGDVLSHGPDRNVGHQAQKPVALFKDLLSRVTSPGHRVLDPFCGSGPVFGAAQELQLVAVGIEVDERAHGLSVARLTSLRTEAA